MLDYILFENDVDTAQFNENILKHVLYGSDTSKKGNDVVIRIKGEGENGES